MEKKANNKKLYVGLSILFIMFIIGVIYTNINDKEANKSSYKFPQPEEVVRQYFTAWNDKNYPDMYATISDGFKKIDPNAKDLATFKSFASSQGIREINIINLKEFSNDGITASVSYSVEFISSDSSKRQFSDKFTLKYRKGDIIQGWKLIHPYGENIDMS